MRADWCNSGIASIESSTYMPDEARVSKWFGVQLLFSLVIFLSLSILTAA
jgi:hypothetical protein